MAKSDEAARMLKRGVPPTEIAGRWDYDPDKVTLEIYKAIGRRIISRSEVLFSIDQMVVLVVECALNEKMILNRWELKHALLEANGGPPDFLEEALLYFDLRDAPLADMFESICHLERGLHTRIGLKLRQGFGQDWWFNGIPENVRKECATRREEDHDHLPDPYSYTTFIHLKEILDKQWEIFKQLLPKTATANKRELIEDLRRVNLIRNKIMHPVRGYRPTKDDFVFVTGMTKKILGDHES